MVSKSHCSQRCERGSLEGWQNHCIVQAPNDSYSNSFNLSLIADLINSVTVEKPRFPMAFDSISSVSDFGIFTEVYSFSAIIEQYYSSNIFTFCAIGEPSMRKLINNEPCILLPWLIHGSYMGPIPSKMNEEDEQNDREAI